MENIANELLETIKWIPERERVGKKWYSEYLDKVNQDLQELNQTNND